MDYLSAREEREVPKCKMKRTDNPECTYHKNTIPYESVFKRNQTLPSPIVKWSDYYQTVPDSTNETKRDFNWMKNLKEKAKKIKERRNGDGEEQ